MAEDKRMSPIQWVVRAFQGALIGAGAILPGISGGVLCVTFGIYQPVMALFSHPGQALRKYWRMFIPVFLGMLIGFLALARVVELLFELSSAIAICLFVGLIAGTLPSLFRDGAKTGTGTGDWVGFSVCMVLIYAFLSFLNGANQMTIAANGWWYLFCGIIWGLSIVIPGLSSSSILIFMGLYQSMTAGIAALDFSVILPMFAGLGLSAALTARFISALFEKRHALATHCVIGIVIASTLLILPTTYANAYEALLSLLAFAIGFTVVLLLDRLDRRTKSGV